LPRELLAIRLDLLFLLDQPAASVFELRLEKLVRAFRQHLAVAEVLLDEQRRETFGHSRNSPGIGTRITDPERLTGEDVYPDVAAHGLDDVLHDPRPAFVGVEIEVLNDSLQPTPAENLLNERLQTIFDSRGDRRTHVLLGNALRDDQNDRLGSIPIRKCMHNKGGGCGDNREWHQEHPNSRLDNPKDVFRVIGLTWQHWISFRVRTPAPTR
jgi:hypothetical protein